MYATNYTYVSTRAVYQMHHTELLTVHPLIRTAEATLEGNHCITIFVVNKAEDRWRMLPVGVSK
jgi:metal-responsive CopG/Arc/MetJ family transcriptional regulator